jgi:CRISPR/Cas system-associated exonuclease Cas4 (RecB family)
MEPFYIAAKNLASLNMPDIDLASYWFLLHLRFRRPWDIFPPIFGAFDRRQKRLARLHIDRKGSAPECFGPFEDVASYLTVGRLKYVDAATNITINGEPDDVFVDLVGELQVVDYKTSDWEGGEDPLVPLYQAQVSTYAFILEAQKYGKVAKAGLIYFTPVTGDADDDLLKCVTKRGMRQDWTVTPIEIEIDRKKTRSLLKAARKLYDMAVPPDCKRKHCKNCTRLRQIYDIYHYVERTKAASTALSQDALMFRDRHRLALSSLRDALTSLDEDAVNPSAGFDLWSHWEWPSEAVLD